METTETEEITEEVNVVMEAKPTFVKMNLHEISGLGDQSIDIMSFGKKRIYSGVSGSMVNDWNDLVLGYYEEFNVKDENGNDVIDPKTGKVQTYQKLIVPGFGLDALLDLASFRVKSQSQEINNLEDLIAEVDLVLKRSFDFAYHVCDSAYKINVVYNTDNEELCFKREHVIVILACSKVFRISLPLLLSFVVDNPNFPDDTNTVILEYFLHAMEEIQKEVGRPVNIHNKLRRLVESRVYGTEYSDTVIWGYLRNLGTNSVEVVQPLLRKLITDITPKLTINENVINLYHVVVKKQLHFMFHANIPLEYENVNSALEPDEASVFDTTVAKFAQNEIYPPLVDLAYKDFVRKLLKGVASGIEVTDDEVEEYTKVFVPSKEKNYIFFALYSKYIEDHEILFALSERRYTYLTLLLHRILLKYNMPNLAKIIMSNTDDENTSKLSTSKLKLTRKFMQSIRESHGYQELQKNCFKYTSDKFQHNNTLLGILENIAKNSRHSVFPNAIGEYEPVTIDDESLAGELLQLAKIIV